MTATDPPPTDIHREDRASVVDRLARRDDSANDRKSDSRQ